MSHRSQLLWCYNMSIRFKPFFYDRSVLDVGSLDINGSVRRLFRGGTYLGIDLVAGKGVDRVCSIDEVDETFDVVVSTEVLEHDPGWDKTLRAMCDRLKSRGLLMLTCAGPGRLEHGTRKCPIDGMTNDTDYYRNLSPWDLLSHFPGEQFRHYNAIYANTDTYLWGLKS